MTEYRGKLRAVGSVGIVVSAYHERITSRLLEGALVTCAKAGLGADQLDVVWVPGAFELGVTAAALARSGRYAAVVALGVVVRGETPHFDFVAGETSRALGETARETGVPVGFGLLTVETTSQAVDRAGGVAGNKGAEAAEAAIRTADLLQQMVRP